MYLLCDVCYLIIQLDYVREYWFCSSWVFFLLFLSFPFEGLFFYRLMSNKSLELRLCWCLLYLLCRWLTRSSFWLPLYLFIGDNQIIYLYPYRYIYIGEYYYINDDLPVLKITWNNNKKHLKKSGNFTASCQ